MKDKKDAAQDGQSNAAPRLLSIVAAAVYLGGVSPWTVRGMIDNGVLPVVRLPVNGRDGRVLRRVFVDRADVDALIEKSKETEVA